MRLNDNVFEVGADFLADGSYPVSVRAHAIRGEQVAMLDMGYHWHPTEVFRAQLNDYGIRLEEVRYCLATHGHSDHVGGGPAISAVSGAPTCLHKEDAGMVSSESWLFEHYFVPMLKVIGMEERIPENRDWQIQFITAPLKIDRMLEGNEQFDLGKGVTLQTIWLPGHSLGSVVYLWKERGWAFCGDTFVGLACESGDLPIIMYPEYYGDSVKKMLGMDLEMLLLGHSYNMTRGPGINLKMGCYVKAFLEDSLYVHEIVSEAVTGALQSCPDAPFNDILIQTMDAVSKKMWISVDYRGGVPDNYRVGSVHWVDTVAAYYAWLTGHPMSGLST